jgi:predicted O-methyltransferase YrrM
VSAATARPVAYRANVPATSAISWIDANTFELGGLRFHLDLARERPVASERLVLMKDRALVDCYVDLFRDRPAQRVVELGIWGGGGTLFLQRLLQPDKLVALDRIDVRIPVLDRHIEQLGLGDAVSCHYGVWQEQTTRIAGVIEKEFGDAPLDVVVDDASHLLEPTRGCFNLLFPKLRPGGLYVVEDWAWAHWPGHYQEGDWLKREPLSDFVFQAVVAVASASHVVASVRVEPGLVAIERGEASFGPLGFDLAKLGRTRGKTLAWV